MSLLEQPHPHKDEKINVSLSRQHNGIHSLTHTKKWNDFKILKKYDNQMVKGKPMSNRCEGQPM